MRRIRNMWRWLVTAAAVTLAAIWWMVLGTPGPDWLPWTVAGIIAAVTVGLGMSVLLGPVARRMAGEPRPLTARDRKRLSVKDRIDAVNNARSTLLQAATGLVVVGGLLFTGAGLIYTARTLDVSARTLDATREGQLTDRYTKAVDQLGQPQIDIRLGGIYALQRLARDSPLDKPTIIDVLIAYIQVHTHPPKSQVVEGQALVDVAAAINVVTRLEPELSGPRFFDLESTDFHSANLARANLGGATLTRANPSDADLGGATLSEATLTDANLTDAGMSSATLIGSTLTRANLTDVDLVYTNLIGSTLTRATLTDVDLSSANLIATDLRGADLRGADLSDASLTAADLRGADLRGVEGMTPAQIKAVAKTDAATKFS